MYLNESGIPEYALGKNEVTSTIYLDNFNLVVTKKSN